MADNENESRGAWRGWIIIVLFSAALVAWGVMNFMLIRDEPRRWDFGVLPSTPSESIYSTTETPAASAVPTSQIVPLPESQAKPAPGGPL